MLKVTILVAALGLASGCTTFLATSYGEKAIDRAHELTDLYCNKITEQDRQALRDTFPTADGNSAQVTCTGDG